MLQDHEIGGATVKRTFFMGERSLRAGEKLTREQFLRIPAANRRSLVEQGKLDPYAMAPGTVPAPEVPVERHIVSAGFGKYHVIEGRRLTETAVTKEKAAEIAGAADPPPN